LPVLRDNSLEIVDLFLPIDLAIKVWLYSEKLKEYWSPEQIMGRLELDKKIKISTETAYRFVLQDKAIGGALYKYLRQVSM
jgi:IS30 family transposase